MSGCLFDFVLPLKFCSDCLTRLDGFLLGIHDRDRETLWNFGQSTKEERLTAHFL